MVDTAKVSGVAGLNQRAYFIYVDEKVLSGQRRATELLIEELAARGWNCRRFGMPGLDRQGNAGFALVVFVIKLLLAWMAAITRFLKVPGLMHVNLGQTIPAMIREGTPLLVCSLFSEHRFGVVSLHGSWFMRWDRVSLKARVLVLLSNRAAFVTVLGEDQRTSLTALGVDPTKILIADNTCELEPVADQFVVDKQKRDSIRVLFLSNLVDTKGYPEFLDGLEEYSRLPNAPRIEGILCGQVIGASHAMRLRDASQAHHYIREKMAAIQRSGVVSMSWLLDAEGERKAELFATTTIFIFPSKLEAQPLVILEAMASGCSIIASDVGQIPRMLENTGNAVISAPDGPIIAQALRELVDHPDRRTAMALGGLHRFRAHFTRKRYGDQWHGIANQVAGSLLSFRRTIWFAFADTAGFSGQKEAVRIIYDNISTERWRVRLIRMPAFERTLYFPKALLSYVFQCVRSMAEITQAMFMANIVLHVAPGQTRISLLRDALPVYFLTAGRSSPAAIISLHGSNFMSWSFESRESRWFRRIMARANYLTVLGESQRRHAVALGIPESKVMVVPNTCDAPGLECEGVVSKQEAPGPVRILHLSSLIDTKGYPAFLEALLILGKESGPPIEAVLCGRITLNAFSERFKSQATARLWIEAMLAKINATARVKVRWVPGAYGEAKWALYREAQLFVFPSTYLVEAQPIVLLEAMAYGCAVISSDVGEIREILDESTAVLLSLPEAERVANAMRELVINSGQRRRIAITAWERYQYSFNKAAHIRVWERLFNSLDPINS